MNPGGPEPLGDLVGVRRAELVLQRQRELDLVDAVVATHDRDLHPVAVDDHRESLQQRAVGHLQGAGDGIDGRHLGRVDLLGRVQRRRQRHRLGLGGGHLEVGRVAGREHHVVLAGSAGRHVLVGSEAAHHPDVGLDPVPLEPAAVHHPVVGDHMLGVLLVQSLAVAVERVGVLHDELAGAQDPGPGTRLVTLLDLEVVEDHRQLAVGTDGRRHVQRDDLLVGHREHHVGAAAVGELEQLLDRIAAAAPPRLGRVQHRHQQLLAPDRVHLLAHDLDDLLVHSPPGRQPGPQPRPDLADQPGADHQLVRDRLGVGRRLTLGGQEVGGEAGHGAFTAQAYPGRRRRRLCRPATVPLLIERDFPRARRKISVVLGRRTSPQ